MMHDAQNIVPTSQPMGARILEIGCGQHNAGNTNISDIRFPISSSILSFPVSGASPLKFIIAHANDWMPTPNVAARTITHKITSFVMVFILPNALDQTFRAVAHKAAPPRL